MANVHGLIQVRAVDAVVDFFIAEGVARHWACREPNRHSGARHVGVLQLKLGLGHLLSSLQVVRNARSLFLDTSALSHQALLQASIAFSMIFLGLLLIWALWFLYAVSSTRAVLKKLPYATSRFQQLCYRFFVYQQLIVVLFVVAVEVVPLISFLAAYAKDPT